VYAVACGPHDRLLSDSTTGLNPDEITIADLLKQQGYATACIGKWHLGHLPPFLPRQHGFDYYYGIPYSNDMEPCLLMRNEEVVENPAVQATLTERYTDEGIRFIRENQHRPFFLYLPHTMPHTPLHISERFAGKSKAGLYGDVIECLDWSTGRILDTLKELDIDDNTLVIFTSDNGPWLFRESHGGCAEPLRAGKGTTYEGGMRVPCVMRWPGKIPAGAICRELATTMDLLPTLAKLAGAQPPSDRVTDGKDIGPLMAGQPGAKTPTKAFYYYFMDSLQAVRSGQWKLMIERTRSFEYPFRHVLKHDVARPDEVVPEALYDLDADIGEQHNVIEKHPEVAERLRGLMGEMRQDIGDRPVDLRQLGLVENRSTIVEGRNCRPIGRT
jgi:arylsulfatase A-like enzyme